MRGKGAMEMKKRMIALLLAAVLLAGLLAGCGEKNEENAPGVSQQPGNDSSQQQTATVQGKYAYQASFYPLDLDGAAIDYIRSFCVSGGSIFFAAECNTGETVEETDPYSDEKYSYEKTETRIFKLDLNTRSTVRLEYTPREIPEGVEGNVYLDNLIAGKDGALWATESYNTYYFDLPEDFDPETEDRYKYYFNGESGTELLQFSADGAFLKRVELNAGEDVSVYNLCSDDQGYLYATDWEQFYVFDSEGTLLAALPNEDYGELINVGGQIGSRYWNEEGGCVFKPIDPVTKTFGEEVKMTDRAYDLLPGVQDYQYLYNYSGTVYGHMADAEEDEKLFSFLDCDVNSSYIRYFTVLEDGTVAGIEQDTSNGWPGTYSLMIMNQVDASTLPVKQEMTLACMYLDWDLRNEIIQFNRSHSDMRIVVKDYSEYNTDDDYNAGLTKLNTEILSGIVPDILYVDQSVPLRQYAAKGILLDLWPLIDADSELSRDDLMTHFFDVLSIDGSLYQLTDCFNIVTAAGLTRVVGERNSWTLSEMLETLQTLEPGATIFGDGDTKEGILQTCVYRSLDQFIDWSNTGSPCSFDSQEFIDMLDFANSFPAEFDWENYDWDNYVDETTRMLTGKQLLTQYYLSGFEQQRYLRAEYAGESLTFVGYPSTNGTGSYFTAYNGLAITTACRNPDVAWSFVRYLLTEEHQENSWAFPTNRHVFEAMKETAMKPLDDGSEVGIAIDAKPVTTSAPEADDYNKPLTEEDCQRIIDLYESCTTVFSSNDDVWKIIQEEAAPFFAGQKTAGETAKLIQNRVSLYVAEQG